MHPKRVRANHGSDSFRRIFAKGSWIFGLFGCKLDTLPDATILEKARAEGAILLTCDLDFGELAIASQNALPSVIIFRLKPPMRADKVNRYLERVLQQHVEDLEQGAVISVSEGQIRVRHLPIT